MATLEIHDKEGRVKFFELQRDHPILFGTSSACDVVLSGEFIRPVHGRIRFKSHKYKIEASPDAEYVLINGHKMTTGSIRQGDEITVGDCRMFLIRVEEELDAAPAGKSPAQDDRTRVAKARSVPVPERGRSRARAGDAEEAPVLESTDWLNTLRNPASERGVASVEAPLRRPASGRRGDEYEVDAPETRPRRPAGPGMLVRLRNLWGSVAPGREKILTSPLVIGLVLSLVLLIGLGFWLRSIINSTIATRTFDRAVQNFDDGDYRTAMRDFDTFLAANPQDKRVGKAQVLRSFANVRQYVTAEGGTWSSALEAANEMLDQVGAIPDFRDERGHLADLLIKVGEGLADRARQGADPKALAEAESVVGLHSKVLGEPGKAFLDKSRLPSKLALARDAVKKAQVRTEALASMDQAIKQTASAFVYDVRDKLLEQYPDLAQDKELLKRMTAANELIRKAVSIDQARRSAERIERPEALGPPTSLVLRSQIDSLAAPPEEDIVYALADGYGYAVHGLTGAPLWHRALGLAAPFAPQPVPGDATAVAIDARTNELVRFDAKTGGLRWRLSLGEPAGDPPLIMGNLLGQVLPSGKLLLVGLESGELESTINLGRPLSRSPVNDESGQHLYLLGKQDCLFILAREPLSCVDVVYLGHVEASIPCAPARLGRFLIVPENNSLYNSRLHVLILDQDGAKVRPVQDVDVAGWTWQTPASGGPIVWGIGDKGGYEAFSVGDYANKTPFRSLARLTADSVSSGPAFALARSDRELWVASGHSGRYDLDPERGAIEPHSPIVQPGPAMAPIQKAGKLLVMTFQDQQTGGVSLWALDPDTNAIVWRTILGAPWVASPVAASGDDLSVMARDGREVLLKPGLLEHGGFVVEAAPKPGAFSLPSGQRLQFESSGKKTEVIVPKVGSNYLWVHDPAAPEAWQKIGLPVEMATPAIAWGNGVLVLGRDARAYLVDPRTGRSIAEPFVPKFDRDHQGNWMPPAVVDQETLVLADDVGHIHRVSFKQAPVPRLVGEATKTIPQHVIAGPLFTGGGVIVVTADKHVRALSTRDFSPVGSWVLDAPLAGEPAAGGDACFVMDKAGGAMALSRDGKRLWAINLKAATVGRPLIKDQSVWFLTSDGNLHVCAMSDGAELDRISLGILPDGGLLQSGKRVFVRAGQGTIRQVAATLRTANEPPSK